MMQIIDATSPWWILEMCYVRGWGQNGKPIPFDQWLIWHRHFVLPGGFRPTDDALTVVRDALRMPLSRDLAA